jgi:hypothetical protein
LIRNQADDGISRRRPKNALAKRIRQRYIKNVLDDRREEEEEMDQRDAELQKMEHRINNESPFNRTLSREKEESYRSKRENDKNLYNPKVQNLVVEYSGDEQQASYLERVRKYPQNRPKEQPKSQLPNRSLDLGLHNRNLLPYIENPKPILVMVEPREGRRDTFYNKNKSSNRT